MRFHEKHHGPKLNELAAARNGGLRQGEPQSATAPTETRNGTTPPQSLSGVVAGVSQIVARTADDKGFVGKVDPRAGGNAAGC